MGAVAVHHTATSGATWDGPAAEKALDTPVGTSVGNDMFAWKDPDGDPDLKGSWKFPHHMVSGGKPGPANLSACASIIGILNGGMGGANIPAGDRQGVYAHAAAHLKDGGENVPELKEAPTAAELEARAARAEARGQEIRCVREMDPRSLVADQFEMREVPDGTGGTKLRFTGYASIVDTPYEMQDFVGPYTEVIDRHAFKETLRRNADVNFLVNHSGVSMARTKPGTLTLHDDRRGLEAEAMLNMTRSDVHIVRSAVDDGELDEMSFAFRCVRQEWSEDWSERRILEVNMHQGDVSIVNYGANPSTAGTVALRSAFSRSGITVPILTEMFRELRQGKALSSQSEAVLKHCLQLASDSDAAVDELQVVLSEFLGVPNPDDKQDQSMHAETKGLELYLAEAQALALRK